MSQPEVTVLIPNYKTLTITTLCLRLLRKHSDLDRLRVIAIDNDSGDASTEYLRSLNWIELIERPAASDDTPSLSHSRALDLGLARVQTPYVLSFHTDTFVRRSGWLDLLLAPVRQDPQVVGVGSWKLEDKPLYKRLAKGLESRVQTVWYGLLGRDRSHLEGTAYHQQYLRSHCALYRTDLLRRYGLTFSAERDTAGRVMHQRLAAAGHRLIFLRSEQLSPYIVHLNHATMVLNPELGSRQRSIRQGQRRIRQILASMDAATILADDSLDRV